jgi:hypothetical protein
MTGLPDVVDELLVLWPALPDALPRDAGASSGERVSTTALVHTVPLNVDVAAVLTDLRRAIPEWTSWAATAAGLSAASTVTGCLRQLPGIHDRLNTLGRTRDAEKLSKIADGWLGACRRALGLTRPDVPFGEYCPNHDDPLWPLATPGDVGQLRYDRLDARGRPVEPYVSWSRTELVLCRHCKAQWTPDRYMFLGRLIKQAKRAREAAAGDAA